MLKLVLEVVTVLVLKIEERSDAVFVDAKEERWSEGGRERMGGGGGGARREAGKGLGDLTGAVDDGRSGSFGGSDFWLRSNS